MNLDRLTKSGIACTLLFVCACSNQQAYDAIKQNQEYECSKLPPGQHEQCMRQVREPYEDYERDRQEVLSES